jgi:hypothetical protein
MSASHRECDPREYAGRLDQLLSLMAKKDKDVDDWSTLWELSNFVVENSSLKNALERDIVEALIEQRQEVDLDAHGGYPIRLERTFEAHGRTFSVIAFGCSEMNEGKDAIDGIVFVWEDAPL